MGRVVGAAEDSATFVTDQKTEAVNAKSINTTTPCAQLARKHLHALSIGRIPNPERATERKQE
jgi:hypothetical protein